MTADYLSAARYVEIDAGPDYCVLLSLEYVLLPCFVINHSLECGNNGHNRVTIIDPAFHCASKVNVSILILIICELHTSLHSLSRVLATQLALTQTKNSFVFFAQNNAVALPKFDFHAPFYNSTINHALQ
jgi:hypothetical protein